MAQFKAASNIAAIEKPKDYKELKEKTFQCIRSLEQENKEELLRKISLLPYEENAAAVMLSIRDFIKEHSNNFNPILYLFDTTGADWKFKDLPESNTNSIDILEMIMLDLSADGNFMISSERAEGVRD